MKILVRAQHQARSTRGWPKADLPLVVFRDVTPKNLLNSKRDLAHCDNAQIIYNLKLAAFYYRKQKLPYKHFREQIYDSILEIGIELEAPKA